MLVQSHYKTRGRETLEEDNSSQHCFSKRISFPALRGDEEGKMNRRGPALIKIATVDKKSIVSPPC